MSLDPNVPTQEIRDLCASPIDWEGLPGFGDECPDALELLQREWIRCFAEESVSSEELRLIEDVLFDNDLYEPPDKPTLKNLQDRRALAAKRYLHSIGRLGTITFMRPSEQGKHYSINGPQNRKRKISYFYTDLQTETLARLFWSWFDDMFVLSSDESAPRRGPFPFLRQVGTLWNSLCNGENVRIAIDTASAIGELNGEPLEHVVIDVAFAGTSVAHAYPVTKAEAKNIMRASEVRLIKSSEY